MKVLRGKNVLLTGGSYGVGIHIAEDLVREGTNVVLVARSADKLKQAVDKLTGMGGRAVSCAADITDAHQRAKVVKLAEVELGHIDILVNNAGIIHTGPFARQAQSEITQILETNLVAPLYLARELLPGMIERRCGHIVTISSLSGKKGVLYEAVYAGTKAALIEWTSAIRMELEGTGVGISVICPIYISDSGELALYGEKAPWLAGSVTAQQVSKAVIRAIKRDLQEVIVRPGLTRPLLALNSLSPSLGNLIVKCMGVPKLQRRLADLEANKKNKPVP